MNADWDQLIEIANRGVRRASVFAAIGLNASKAEPPLPHVLDGNVQIRFVEENISPEQRKGHAENFGKWIIANAIREVIETLGLYLTEMAALSWALQQESPTVGDFQRFKRRYSYFGVEDQYSKLVDVLSVSSDFIDTIASLNKMRNCITHRAGVVGDEDLKGKDKLILSWRVFGLMTSTGHDLTSTLISGEGYSVQRSESLALGWIAREKEFALGDVVDLTQHELSELFLSVASAAVTIHRGSIELARAKGHIVVETPQPPPQPL